MMKDFQVGVKGLICVEDSCLVLKSSQGFWDIPGGRIDGNETIEQTLQRELREELSHIGEYVMKDVVHAYRLSKNIIDDKGLLLLFYKIETTPFKVVLSDEHQDFRWVTKETLQDLLKGDAPIEQGYFEAIRRVLN
jgi:8-oxo-dGTP diphosphatase